MSRIRPVTARLAPQWQISSQHFAQLPICAKMFHSQYYLVATVIRIVFTQSDIYIYTYIHTHTHIYTHTHTHTHTHILKNIKDVGRTKKLVQQRMARTTEILPCEILGTRATGSTARPYNLPWKQGRVRSYCSTRSLTSAVNGSGWLTPRPDRFTLWNEPALI